MANKKEQHLGSTSAVIYNKNLRSSKENMYSVGGCNCRRNNFNNNSNNPTSCTKRGVKAYYQWTMYCHSCRVVLRDKRGCGARC